MGWSSNLWILGKRYWLYPDCILNIHHFTDTDAKSYSKWGSSKVLESQERDKKKRKYLEAYLVRRHHFTPFVYSLDGMLGWSAKTPNILVPNGKSPIHMYVDTSMLDWALPLFAPCTCVAMWEEAKSQYTQLAPVIPKNRKMELAYHYLNIGIEHDGTLISYAADPGVAPWTHNAPAHQQTPRIISRSPTKMGHRESALPSLHLLALGCYMSMLKTVYFFCSFHQTKLSDDEELAEESSPSADKWAIINRSVAQGSDLHMNAVGIPQSVSSSGVRRAESFPESKTHDSFDYGEMPSQGTSEVARGAGTVRWL